jgi:hypothetical protein
MADAEFETAQPGWTNRRIIPMLRTECPAAYERALMLSSWAVASCNGLSRRGCQTIRRKPPWSTSTSQHHGPSHDTTNAADSSASHHPTVFIGCCLLQAKTGGYRAQGTYIYSVTCCMSCLTMAAGWNINSSSHHLSITQHHTGNRISRAWSRVYHWPLAHSG